MTGIIFYAVVSVIVAVAAFLVSEWIREPGVPAPDRPGAVAAVAGILWPVLLIGAAQWALVAAAHRRLRRQVSSVPDPRVEVRV